MKKFFRNQKGFSMIELLVALLIMAVIAGIAMAVFGNIVGKSRGSADTESAAQIKKQLLYYINEANDPDLSCLVASDSGASGKCSSADELVDRLGGTLSITTSGIAGTNHYVGSTSVPGAASATWSANSTAGEVLGDYGPYIDGAKRLRPQANGDLHWAIHVNTINQQITVTTTSGAITDANKGFLTIDDK